MSVRELARTAVSENLEGRTVVQIWPAAKAKHWRQGDGFGEVKLLDGSLLVLPPGLTIRWEYGSWYPLEVDGQRVGAKRIGQIVRT